MKLSDKTKLLITWAGALIMQTIFITMMVTEQMSIERYYRLQQRQRTTPARVVRMPLRQNSRKQILVAR